MICFMCSRKKRTSPFLKTDIGKVLYICYNCSSFHIKQFNKKIIINKSFNHIELITNVTRMLSQLEINLIPNKISAIKGFFSYSFPWNYVCAIAVWYSEKKDKASAKSEPYMNSWLVKNAINNFYGDNLNQIISDYLTWKKEQSIKFIINNSKTGEDLIEGILLDNINIIRKISLKPPGSYGFNLFCKIHELIKQNGKNLIVNHFKSFDILTKKLLPLYLEFNQRFKDYDVIIVMIDEFNKILREINKYRDLKKKNLAYREMLNNISSHEDFVKNIENICEGIFLLEVSAKEDPENEEYKTFKIFHEKFIKHFDKLVIINYKVASQLLESVKPIYLYGLGEIRFYDKTVEKQFYNIACKLKSKNKNISPAQEPITFLQKQADKNNSISTNVIFSEFPTEDEYKQIRNILIYFQEHAWNEIRGRKYGLPAGNWYGRIENKNINESGYYFYNIKEERNYFLAKLWSTSKKDEETNFKFIFGEKHPESILFTYILCALSDMVTGRQDSKGIIKSRNYNKRKSFLNIRRIKYFPRKTLSLRNYKERRRSCHSSEGCFIPWHLRKLNKGSSASETARKKALLTAGLTNLPEGYTFVEAYWRGQVDEHIKRVVVSRLTVAFTTTLSNLL